MPSLRFLTTFLVVLLLSIAGILLAQKVYRDMKKERAKAKEHDDVSNIVPVADADRPALQLVLFYAKWCGACNKIKNQWNALATKYNNPANAIEGFRVECRKVDCSHHTTNEYVQRMLDEYEIKAFPSVVLLIPSDFQSRMGNTTYLRYQGKISVKTLETFINKTAQEMKQL